VDLLYCLPCDVFNWKCKTATLVVTYAGSRSGSALDMALLGLEVPESLQEARLVHLQLLVSFSEFSLFHLSLLQAESDLLSIPVMSGGLV